MITLGDVNAPRRGYCACWMEARTETLPDRPERRPTVGEAEADFLWTAMLLAELVDAACAVRSLPISPYES